jgi:hypothetical protein
MEGHPDRIEITESAAGEEVPQETIQARMDDTAALRSAFLRCPRALEIVLGILHWPGPVMNDGDKVLHNAAQTLLHHLGAWGDSKKDRERIVRKLLSLPPRQGRWRKIKGG